MLFHLPIQVIAPLHLNWSLDITLSCTNYSPCNVRCPMNVFFKCEMVVVNVVNIFTCMAMLDPTRWVSIEIISNMNCVIIFLFEQEITSWKQTINYSWHMHAFDIWCYCEYLGVFITFIVQCTINYDITLVEIWINKHETNCSYESAWVRSRTAHSILKCNTTCLRCCHIEFYWFIDWKLGIVVAAAFIKWGEWKTNSMNERIESESGTIILVIQNSINNIWPSFIDPCSKQCTCINGRERALSGKW